MNTEAIRFTEGRAEKRLNDLHYGEGEEAIKKAPRETHIQHRIDLLLCKINTGQCTDEARARKTLEQLEKLK